MSENNLPEHDLPADTDLLHLKTLDRKLQIIRDCTEGVVRGYNTGLYVYGSAGTGKSFTVQETLERLRAPYQLHNSRLTAKGLFELISDSPEDVHVIEDLESLLCDRVGASVLRAALWSNAGRDWLRRLERPVTWRTAQQIHKVIFGSSRYSGEGGPDF